VTGQVGLGKVPGRIGPGERLRLLGRTVAVATEEVDQRAEEHGRPRHREPFLPEPQEQRYRQAAARRVTRDGEFRWPWAAAEQPSVRGNGVLNRCRKRMLRREPIIEHEHAGLRTAASAPA
jgi:hypothetical protein